MPTAACSVQQYTSSRCFPPSNVWHQAVNWRVLAWRAVVTCTHVSYVNAAAGHMVFNMTSGQRRSLENLQRVTNALALSLLQTDDMLALFNEY